MNTKHISLNIRYNTPQEEFASLKDTIEYIPFYREHGYKIVLPEIEELTSERVLSDEKQMFQMFLDNEYNKVFFYKRGGKCSKNCSDSRKLFSKIN